jgi:hypothetical protein
MIEKSEVNFVEEDINLLIGIWVFVRYPKIELIDQR